MDHRHNSAYQGVMGTEDAVAWRLWHGEDARSVSFDSGRWRLPQFCRRWLLFPGGGSFFSFTVVGSSLRGVKATTALRRRL
ncbi:hypothetical protein F2Q69_00007499 [Brassica cretica]|uniref:Uncharacterized protein n=1 Tax=Brassica cretica TaxID=69181 RepID=A0A8S9PJQ2_BRACR|nr:hypothetical protein F2Q69_00007499 [Brassica cretica]